MPQQITPETRERYVRALQMRDNGATFREIAEACGYADAGTARYAWIGGLRLAGRDSEVPTRTPRRIRVTMPNASGQPVTRVMTVDSLESWTTTSTLTFGIEIECVGLTQLSAARALRDAGVHCEVPGYTHRTMASWKVVPDGSLRGRNGACEVVSPVLIGTDGLAEVRTVMKILRDAGARVNESCGMHVHVGVDNLSRAEQAAVIEMYHAFQWAFTAWVKERRINGSWARLRNAAMTTTLVSSWMRAQDNDAVRSVSRYNDRYFALNVASYERHGTFEFRAHHGSLNGTNAAAWIALTTAFIEYARLAVARGNRVGDMLWSAWGIGAAWIDNERTIGNSRGRNMPSQDVLDACNGQTIPNTRESAGFAARQLVTILVNNGLLASDVGEYLKQRACNIPTNNRNQ